MSLRTLDLIRYQPSQSMRSLAQHALAAALVTMFIACAALTGLAAQSAQTSPQDDREDAPTVRERLQALPPHTMIQVKLHDKRIKGRLSVVTRKGFVIKVTAGGKTENKKIAYNDVQSLDTLDNEGNKVAIHVVVESPSGTGVDVEIDH